MRILDAISIAQRYMRSVNLERDIAEDSAVSGYVVTPIGLDFLRRLGLAFHNPGPRSWSITGPYGSGKSAFVLFLLNLLRGKNGSGASESRLILKSAAAEVWSDLYDQRKSNALRPEGFLPVLVSGSPRPTPFICNNLSSMAELSSVSSASRSSRRSRIAVLNSMSSLDLFVLKPKLRNIGILAVPNWTGSGNARNPFFAAQPNRRVSRFSKRIPTANDNC